MANFDKLRGKREIQDLESEEITYAVVPVKRNYFDEDYFCMFQKSLDIISEDRDMTYDDLRVLLKLFRYLDMKNYISVSQKDICEQLKMHKPNVSRAINKLIEKGIILKGPKVIRANTYILNANYAYKGHLKNLKEERKRHLELVEEYDTERHIDKKIKSEIKSKDNKKEEKKELSEAEKLINNKKHPTLF
ncbi:MAG: helix-turn-helix domain-containing protein [Silvanigrellaceae bacterium]|nr:helix-turn-helix domain-containing protein [Silvanigrellaceae bacterium]